MPLSLPWRHSHTTPASSVAFRAHNRTMKRGGPQGIHAQTPIIKEYPPPLALHARISPLPQSSLVVGGAPTKTHSAHPPGSPMPAYTRSRPRRSRPVFLVGVHFRFDNPVGVVVIHYFIQRGIEETRREGEHRTYLQEDCAVLTGVWEPGASGAGQAAQWLAAN